MKAEIPEEFVESNADDEPKFSRRESVGRATQILHEYYHQPRIRIVVVTF
jgi:hypothetical protein